MDALAHAVARPIEGLLPVHDAREPLRVAIASLAPGGAERIVLEWLAAEHARGRSVELAVLHARREALAVPQGIEVIMRDGRSPQVFLAALAARWRTCDAPVSTHLLGDEMLAAFWEGGVATVPTVHNVREGWRNDPSSWPRERVPLAVACARAVRDQLVAAGCRVPIVTLRHRPRVDSRAFDPAMRARVREELGIAPGTFLVGAAGAIKPQKDYARAIDVLAALARRRDAALVILGGVLDRAALPELDGIIERAVKRGVASRLRLPGFVASIDPYLAACDAWLNVSRFEGLSMAVQEALAAGLPVLATNVGGQGEIVHTALELLGADVSAGTIAARLLRHRVRSDLARGISIPRAPRIGSLACTMRTRARRSVDTLFVTANLNAGGAQRSLVNLARAIGPRHPIAIAVCGDTTHPAFASALREAGIEAFRPAPSADPFAVAESLLAHAHSRGAANLCFWNVDPKVKLLAAKFAPPSLAVIDVSPGAYSFEEMDAACDFAEAATASREDYYARLDALVLKHDATSHPACRRVTVIRNGVAMRAREFGASRTPRFLVSGRIAPSKRLEVIVAAFARVHAAEPEAELHIVGIAEERHREYFDGIVSAARSLPVRFRGACFDHSCLDEPFTAAIVLGVHQGCPNTVLEAMAASIPVIANASGGTGELVVGGETGWLLREDAEMDELAAAMLECHREPERARTFAAAARARMRAAFTLEEMAHRYLEVLAPRERMTAWNSASVRAAPLPSRADPLPEMASP